MEEAHKKEKEKGVKTTKKRTEGTSTTQKATAQRKEGTTTTREATAKEKKTKRKEGTKKRLNVTLGKHGY